MSDLSIMTINGVNCYEENGTAYLNLEAVARGLGFTTVAASGNEVVRWNTVHKYLVDLGVATSCNGTGYRDNCPDYIPENVFYRLAMKAKNEAAEKFQALVADEIIPSIRKTGGYQMKPQMPVKMSDVFQAMAQTARLAEEASDTANNALKSISLLSAAQEVMDKKLTATADVLAAPSPADDVWQTETKKAVTRIVEAQGFGYQRYWQELYEKLEQRAGANLETRQNNLKSRLKKQGATAAEINNVSKLNVIARDKKLRDIFTNIIQREQARHILKGA